MPGFQYLWRAWSRPAYLGKGSEGMQSRPARTRGGLVGAPSRAACIRGGLEGALRPLQQEYPPSRGNAQALDVGGAARLRIERDERPMQGGRPPGRLEADGHLGHEALDDLIAIDPNHPIGRSRHAEIGDIGGSP